MLRNATRVALLGSVAAFAVTAAFAQAEQAEESLDPEACVNLAERLANNQDIDSEVRTQIEDIISEGDVTQCQVVFTAWEEEGTVTQESLELVARDTASQRMIVQQEVEVDAEAAVYQPPAEVGVEAGAPEIIWTLPRQSVTVDEQAPRIVVRQGRPTVNVEVPQPRVVVSIPKPEVIITWPDSTVDMSSLEPNIEVRMPEPTVTVNVPEPVVELTIGGEDPSDLVQLEDGRFAPKGATEQDLEPRISINQQEAQVSRGREAEEPEIVFNRQEPEVTFESQEPEVSVNVLGEPEVSVSVEEGNGGGNVTIREAGEGEGQAEGMQQEEQTEGMQQEEQPEGMQQEEQTEGMQQN